MAFLEEALELLTGDTNRERGTKFERLMRAALERHPGEYGRLRFKRVLMWADWAAGQAGETGQDTGIDLVGEEHSGRLCAIQCKFYAADHKLTQPEIDPFIAASATRQFASRILIYTGSDLNANVEKRLQKVVDPQVETIYRHHLAAWDVSDWRDYINNPDGLKFEPPPPKEPRPYQQEAIKAIVDGFAASDKGKLILPCGTGKTLIHLWAAEQLAGRGGRVLYVMPSLSLMAQTMKEWANNRTIDHSYIAVCSDPSVGKRNDTGGSLDELPAPATTNPVRVAELLADAPSDRMSVVFSSYQSLGVVSEAQQKAMTLPFDFVVCDEAHRTTGIEDYEKATSDGGEISGFRLIHDEYSIDRKRVLFSTATPRLYTSSVKGDVSAANAKEGEGRYGIYSMDDEDTYGKEFYRLNFSEAIRDGYLADYQVIAVGVKEDDPYIQGALERIRQDADGAVRENNRSYKRDTYFGMLPEVAVSLLGCYDALANPMTQGVGSNTDRIVGTLEKSGFHARKAIAFTNSVETSEGVREVMSSAISGIRNLPDVSADQRDKLLQLEVAHVDGTMNSLRRARALDWLRGTDKEDNEARLLSNARCLTEGVDVPDLDAVLFLAARRSHVDIVQAVGRVMRQPANAKHPKTGYIILPVLIPEGKTMDQMISDNQSGWGRIWSVVQALKSHDDRLDAWVDAADLTTRTSTTTRSPLVVIDPTADFDNLAGESHAIQGQLDLLAADAIASQIVLTCGSKQWWPSWGAEAKEILAQVESLLERRIAASPASAEAFDDYLAEMRGTLGEQLPAQELLELLAQHIITYPIFETLADEDANNPIGEAFEEGVKKIFDNPDWRTEGKIPELLAPLSVFYAGVRERGTLANTSEAKTRLVLEIYDSFFAEALPDTQAKLGIAYTPTWIVDFILRSADAVSRQEFGHGITSKNVLFLDPFTGTGTFPARLLSENVKNGEPLIRTQDLEHKYHHEVHAAEIQPLAYHIASLQIAEAYKTRGKSDNAVTFQHISLADTFKLTLQSGQQAFFQDEGLLENDDRKQKAAQKNITIIATNPPWSSGQDSANEDVKTEGDKDIEKRVKESYVARQKQIASGSPGGNAAGNLYIQSLRWMTDRLSVGNEAQIADDDDEGVFVPQLGKGIVAFVHPNSLSNGTSLAGARACLRDEFSKIYVVNLRSDQYKNGAERLKEGDVVFQANSAGKGGSRSGLQITICVSNPSSAQGVKPPAELLFAEVPEYASLDEKREWLEQLGDVVVAETAGKFALVPLNDKHDWINITDGSFDRMLEVCSTDKKRSKAAASSHASGVKTNCDTFVYAFNQSRLVEKVRDLIDHYEGVRQSLHRTGTIKINKDDEDLTEATRHTPETMEVIKWTETLKDNVRRNVPITFDETRIREVLYRPFQKLFLYEDDRILSRVKTVSRLFPRNEITRGGGEPLPPHHQPRPDTFRNSSQPHTLRSRQRGRSNQSDTPPAAIATNAQGNSFGVMAIQTPTDLGALLSRTGSTRLIPRMK